MWSFNDVYFPVNLGFCPGEKAWCRHLKLIGWDGSTEYPTHSAAFNTLHPKEGLPWGIITVADRIDDLDDPTQIIALIVHECVHMFQWICDEIGETHPSKEFEAYTIQYLSVSTIGLYSRLRYGKKKP